MNSKLYCINPNTKEYEEVKTIFGIDIEEILDLIRDYKMSKDLKFDKFGKLEEIERQKEIIRQLDIKNLELTTIIKEVREYVNHYETIRGYYVYEENGYDEYNYEEDLKQELLEILDKEK